MYNGENTMVIPRSCDRQEYGQESLDVEIRVHTTPKGFVKWSLTHGFYNVHIDDEWGNCSLTTSVRVEVWPDCFGNFDETDIHDAVNDYVMAIDRDDEFDILKM